MLCSTDKRIVMALDAGGTNFRFSAIRGNKPVTQTVALPSNGDNLAKCLANIVEGFTRVKKQCPEPPVAISFVFPGPADYPNGIIGDLGNLPGFRGGVALGPMLEGVEAFQTLGLCIESVDTAHVGGFKPQIPKIIAGRHRRF